MAPRWLQVAGLTGLLGVAVAPAAHADTRWSINIGVGAPRFAVPPSYRGVWEPGRYVWTGYGYRWVQGRWILPPTVGARRFAPYQYDRDDRRWDNRGGWDRDRDRYRDNDGRDRRRDWDRDWRR